MVVGQFVTSKAGHDKGMLYVVCACEGDYLYLCDGRLKTLASPKKKRLKHVQPINAVVDPKLAERLANGGKVYDEEIKFAVKQHMNQSCGKQREEIYVKE